MRGLRGVASVGAAVVIAVGFGGCSSLIEKAFMPEKAERSEIANKTFDYCNKLSQKADQSSCQEQVFASYGKCENGDADNDAKKNCVNAVHNSVIPLLTADCNKKPAAEKQACLKEIPAKLDYK